MLRFVIKLIMGIFIRLLMVVNLVLTMFKSICTVTSDVLTYLEIFKL